MAFRKAAAKQAAIKMGLYGPAGSGKTFTALLVAEGLAKATGKRIAFVDTEHGTDFYSKAVGERQKHPEAFDFDALYTRSLTETTRELKLLKVEDYGVAVIDSITHMWEAARAAYSGKQTRIGTIPMHAWGSIKKPYKELVTFLLNSPWHVLICGRQGNEYAEDEEGELKHVGVKMKAEGETPYEPHILVRMEAIRPSSKAMAVPTAFIEKDRTGVLAGKAIAWPNFENLGAPILRLLGGEQAQMPDDDLTAAQDAEAVSDAQVQKSQRSAELLRQFKGQFLLANAVEDVEKISKSITPAVKKDMLATDVDTLRELYLECSNRIKGIVSPNPNHQENHA
jgi:hypothetical protein